MLSGIIPDGLSDISLDISPDVLSGMAPDIVSGTSSEILWCERMGPEDMPERMPKLDAGYPESQSDVLMSYI